MTLPEVLLAIRRSLLLVGVVIIAVFGGTAAYVAAQTPEYEATSSVLVATAPTGDGEAANIGFAQQVVGTYAELATKAYILDPVIEDLKLDTTAADLAENVVATSEDDRLLINITATANNAELSADIANGVAAQLVSGVGDITKSTTTGTTTTRAASPVSLTVVEAATAPPAPVRPAVLATLLAGLVAGLLIGIIVAIVRARLDTRVREARDLEAAFDRPVLGTLPSEHAQSADHVITRTVPTGRAAEAYRALRTNLEFLGADEAVDSIVVTSAVPGEGKSTCVVNLGVVMATAEKRVLIIDADLRKPRLAKYTGVDGGLGLTDVLIGRATLADAVQQWGPEGLFVLPAGTPAPNPSELLHSRAMAELAASVREEYDLVLFDSPPLTAVTDAAIVARLTAGALVACALGRTRGPQTEIAIDALEKAQAPVLGFVATFQRVRGHKAYQYADKTASAVAGAPATAIAAPNRS